MIRIKRVDKKNSLSLVIAAEKEIEFAFSLKINEKSASTIIRNIYESFRMLGDALSILRGIEFTDHYNSIKELIKLPVNTKRPIQIVDSLRLLRHNINYYGYRPSILEAKDVIEIAKACFEPLKKEIISQIDSLNA